MATPRGRARCADTDAPKRKRAPRCSTLISSLSGKHRALGISSPPAPLPRSPPHDSDCRARPLPSSGGRTSPAAAGQRRLGARAGGRGGSGAVRTVAGAAWAGGGATPSAIAGTCVRRYGHMACSELVPGFPSDQHFITLQNLGYLCVCSCCLRVHQDQVSPALAGPGHARCLNASASGSGSVHNRALMIIGRGLMICILIHCAGGASKGG